MLKITRALPEHVTLGEALERWDFGGKFGEEECLEVLRVLGDEGEVLSCLYFFEWMGFREPCLVVFSSVSIVGRAGKGDELVVVLKNLPFKQKSEFQRCSCLQCRDSGLLSCGRYNVAWKVYEMMETSNIRPDHVTTSIMITVMRKNGDSAQDAWKFFENMNQKGVKWSLEAVGALIKLFCDEGLRKGALIIQSELEKWGIPSNAVICNTIMDAYEEMEGAGLEPNVRLSTCLISAYGRQKKMSDMAAEAFLRMKKLSVRPSHSYTALIHAYSISGWHENDYIAFDNVLREGIKPSIETYTALLDAFRRGGDADTLMKIWKMMIKKKVEGTQVTFSSFLCNSSNRLLVPEASFTHRVVEYV